MGQKISILIIDKVYDKPFTELTKEIGLGESKVIKDSTMGHSLYAFHPNIRMGYYQNKTVIAYNQFIEEFFHEFPSELEQRLCHIFNDCLMLLLIYHENDNELGFSLIDKGERIRTKFVEFYEGTLLDYGPKLEEEKGRRFWNIWSLVAKRIIGVEFLGEWGNVNEAHGLEHLELVTLKLNSKKSS